MLTQEDHLIFRRMPVHAQARLHKADRRDAERMLWFFTFANDLHGYMVRQAAKAFR